MSDTASVRRAQDNVFWGRAYTYDSVSEEEQNAYSSKSVSAVSEKKKKKLSWARLTEAMSDMHIFQFPNHKHGNHAEYVCCGKIPADATNQMKADLPLPLLQREG